MPTSSQGCRLLPGFNGLVVQGILMALSFLLLVCKKKIEVKYSNRTWSEFALDSSKQVIGSLWLHALNLIIAVQQHKHHEAGDSCDWYWINIVVDCTIGTAVEYGLFILLMRMILPRLFSDKTMRGLHSGEYGGCRWSEMQWSYYYKQLAVWLIICSLMKFIVVGIMTFCRSPLISLASIVLSRYDDYPSRKLMIVMIITPLCLNSGQLWVIDNIIKKSERVDEKSKMLLQEAS